MEGQNKQIDRQLEEFGLVPVFLYPEDMGEIYFGPVRQALAYLRQDPEEDAGLACMLGNEKHKGKYAIHNGIIAAVTDKRQVYVGHFHEGLYNKLDSMGFEKDAFDVPHSRDSGTFLRNITVIKAVSTNGILEATTALTDRIRFLEGAVARYRADTNSR
tara:strand:- start:1580 stop:2056 length:477 start_codon:yes stop_codon:yes gene_type:complete